MENKRRLCNRDYEIENNRLNEEVAQHIRWNENHCKRIVELDDENKQLREAMRESILEIKMNIFLPKFKALLCNVLKKVNGNIPPDVGIVLFEPILKQLINDLR